MAKRHKDALQIQWGACNPSAIALSIVEACCEMRDEPDHKGTAEICADPAIRLMVHQLAHLCNINEIENGVNTYSYLIQKCEEANE